MTVTNEERQQLYSMAQIAGDIRMEHDVSLNEALDMVKRYPGELPSNKAEQRNVIKHVLRASNHTCTKKCTEAKIVE